MKTQKGLNITSNQVPCANSNGWQTISRTTRRRWRLFANTPMKS